MKATLTNSEVREIGQQTATKIITFHQKDNAVMMIDPSSLLQECKNAGSDRDWSDYDALRVCHEVLVNIHKYQVRQFKTIALPSSLLNNPSLN